MATRPNWASTTVFRGLLVVPTAVAALALWTHRIEFKLAVPGSCALLLLAFGKRFGLPRGLYVVGAFVASMVGDWFLSNRSGHPQYFVYGIAAFLVAHLGYLGYALCHGRLHRLAMVVLLAGYLPFFQFYLRPAIKDSTLFIAVLAYLLVSCVSLAAAIGMRVPPAPRAGYVAGIASIVLSDTIIALSEFVQYRAANAWILPTYYLAHLCVTLALTLHPGPGAASSRNEA